MAIDVQKNIEPVYAPYTDQSILGSDYYTGQIEEDSEFNTPYGTRTGIGGYYDRFTGPIKNTFQKYGAPIMGGLMSAFTGIPGIGLLMRNLPNDPYAENYRTLADGAYMSSIGLKDKFGYNIGPTLFKNNFLQPGSNSFRSYALQGLKGLDQNVANRYYQETYGKSFDDVKKDIQQKKDPFSQQNVFEGTSDYQGDSGSGGQGGVQSSGFADDGGPVSNRTGRGRQGYMGGGLTSL